MFSSIIKYADGVGLDWNDGERSFIVCLVSVHFGCEKPAMCILQDGLFTEDGPEWMKICFTKARQATRPQPPVVISVDIFSIAQPLTCHVLKL